jgi:hypothetical protein
MMMALKPSSAALRVIEKTFESSKYLVEELEGCLA